MEIIEKVKIIKSENEYYLKNFSIAVKYGIACWGFNPCVYGFTKLVNGLYTDKEVSIVVSDGDNINFPEACIGDYIFLERGTPEENKAFKIHP